GELFLFDEPEAGIDLWSFENLIEIFRGLKDKTIIIVSHQKKILDIADNIVLLNRNNQVYSGKREDIMPLIDMNKCSILEAKNG
ncbi:MAG: ABC transporter ATP-binding protein, partial [Clostridia bacterium]|nr:ABC transporter ATP-binding protein [Clostridia bacterium]